MTLPLENSKVVSVKYICAKIRPGCGYVPPNLIVFAIQKFENSSLWMSRFGPATRMKSSL